MPHMSSCITDPHARMNGCAEVPPTLDRGGALTLDRIRAAEAFVEQCKNDATIATIVKTVGNRALVKLVEKRLAAAEELLLAHREALPKLEAGEAAYREAYAKLCASEADVERGSLDPEEALRLQRELVVAASAERARRHALPGLRAAASSPIARLQKMSVDEDAKRREKAISDSEALVGFLVSKWSSFDEARLVASKQGEAADAAMMAWFPLGEELARRAFKKAEARSRTAPEAGDLDACFAARRAGFQRAVERARQNLESLSGKAGT